jgi:hypothetical protein
VDEEDPATEIYVPLVHYADERLLAGGHRVRQSGEAESINESVDEEARHRSGKGSPGGSTINLETVPVLPAIDMTASTSSSGSTELTVGGPELPLRILAEKGKVLVDVDVKVSGGRWTVEGQVLRWWYDVPGPGEPDREYTIEIRRRGGVIDVKTAGEPGWIESVCPSGPCSIM